MIYFLAGCVFVVALMVASSALSRMDALRRRRVMKWLMIAAGAVVALILLRAGWPLIAAIIGGAGVFLPKLFRWIGMFQMAKGVLGKKGAKKARHKEQAQTSANKMTATQAAAFLGVSEDASAEEIKQRYQHLMKQMHPDKGGSEHLAQQLNVAKDVLLKRG